MTDKFISELTPKISSEISSSYSFVIQPAGGQENQTYRIELGELVDWIQTNTNYTEVYSLPVAENILTGDSQITVISDLAASPLVAREPIITCKETGRRIGINTEDPVTTLDVVTPASDTSHIGKILMSNGDNAGDRMGFDVTNNDSSPSFSTLSIGKYIQSTSDLEFIPLISVDENNNTTIGLFDSDSVCEIQSYTKLGENGPEIKQKKLVGTTNSAQGGSTTIAHGFADNSKIIGCSVLVKNSLSGELIPPNDLSVDGCYYSYKISDTFITIYNQTDPYNSPVEYSSENILSQDIICLITYEK